MCLMAGRCFVKHRRTTDGEVDRVRDEAQVMRTLMELLCQFVVSASGDGYAGMEHDLGETSAAIWRLDHRATGAIRICHDDDVCLGAEVQVPQHMA